MTSEVMSLNQQPIMPINPIELVIKNVGALIYVIDINTYEILYANEYSQEIFGNLIGKTCYKVLQNGQESPCSFCPLYQTSSDEELSSLVGTTVEWENHNTINGRHYAFVDRITSWYDGRITKVQVGIDITRQKEHEAEIIRLAQYDSLTGLPNRLLLKELLTQIQKNIARKKEFGALLFIDLDHFKSINDTNGHDIGDSVLIEVARRLKMVLRESDILARLGGDEFVIAVELQELMQIDAKRKISQFCEKILDVIKEPFFVDKAEFHLTTSIGIVLFDDHIYTNDELMKFADSAMYKAKEIGRDTFYFFS